jgi:hypothetical protein
MVLPLPHLPGMVPSLVRAVSSSAALGARFGAMPRGEGEGGIRGGTLSHSNSNTDLDMSCHGPADPNGYGGLQWTPAPLASLLGAKALLNGGEGEGGAGDGGNGMAPAPGSQSPAKQKRKIGRAVSGGARVSGDSAATEATAAAAATAAAVPGFLARSL